jgi:hypothetical protein
MTVTTAQVTTLLENVLFESASVAAANAPTWTGIANVNPAYSTVSGLSAYLAQQPEAGIAEQIVRYYEGALGRVPSPSEISFYVSYLEKGLTASQLALGTSAFTSAQWGTIAGFFTNSTEFKTDFGLTNGLTASNEGLVITGFYTNVLGRAPSASEIQFYETAIANGVATPTTLLEFFTNSTEFENKVDGQIQTNLGAAGVAAVTAVAAGTNPLASTTPIGPTAPAVPTTFTLTDGVDTLTGSNSGSNTFVAADDANGNSTFTSLDSITGVGGSNTFTWAHSGNIAGAPAGATVTGIQTAIVAAGGSLTLNTTSWTGLTTLDITSGTGATVTAATTTAINDLNSVATDAITGGSVVTVKHSTAGNITVSGAGTSVNVTSTFGTVGVTKDAGSAIVSAKGTITIDGATTLAATDATGVAYATYTADIAALKTAAAAASAATSAKVAATTEVTNLTALSGAAGADATFAALKASTLAAANAGTITAAQMATINEAYDDALTATGGTTAKAEAAAVAAITTIKSAAVSTSQAAVSALAVATAAKTAASTTVTTDAGKGTVQVISNANNSALTSATVTGDYGYTGVGNGGTITISDTSTLDTVLTSVTLLNAGKATLTGNGITTVTDTDGSQSVTVNNVTVSHSLTLNLDNVAETAFTVGTVNEAVPVITDAAATTVVINNADNTKIDLVAGDATKLTITGTGSFSDTTALAQAAAVIDASAATGAVSVVVTAGQAFTGGSGGSTVEITSNAAETKAVKAGTGAANTLIVDHAAAVGSSTAAAFFTGFTSLADTANANINLSLFTGSTITSIILDNATASVSGLNATQAANVTDAEGGAGTVTVGISGATTVGQLDTLHLTANDGTGAAQTITALTAAGVETLHFTLANNLIVSSLTGDAAVTSVVADGSGNFSLTTGALALNVNTVIDAHAVSGTVTVNASAATANGLEIIGSTTGANTLTGNALSDVFVGGSGNDTISNGVGAGAITQTVTDGNGNNTITLNDTGHADTDTITVGNGYNVITDKTTNGTVKVTVGTGSNTIDLHTGSNAAYSATVTLGTHTGDAGGDIIDVGVAAAAATGVNTVIKGVVSGDSVVLVDAVTAYAAVSSTVQATITALGTGAGAFATALGDAINGLASHAATSFDYNGNTYVVENSSGGPYNSASLLSAGDTFIELTGIHTFSTTVAAHTLALTA